VDYAVRPEFFAGVVIETQMATPHVRQVSEDIVLGYLNLAVLNILGMYKFDRTQYVQLL